MFSSLQEADYPQADWKNITKNKHNKVFKLHINLQKAIENHNKNDTFSSYSKIHPILKNVFYAFLLWTFEPNIRDILHPQNTKLRIPTQTLILDILSMIWQQMQTSNALITRYSNLITIHLLPIMDEDLFRLNLCPQMCIKLNLFTNVKLPKSKNNTSAISILEIRRKTSMCYVQKKFNLMIEESEGYSKIVSYLAEYALESKTILKKNLMIIDDENDEKQNINIDHQQRLQSTIFQIIGQFKLDPNRVIDIILEALEANPSNINLQNTLKKNFNSKNISIILGFKLKFYEISIDNKNTGNGRNANAPKALYIMTCHLIHNRIISVTDIISYLTPNMKYHSQMHEEWKQSMIKLSKLITYHNLNENEQQKKNREKEEEKLYSADKKYKRQMKSSQIFQLLMHMIQLGDWRNANVFLRLLKSVQPQTKNFINEKMLNLLEFVMYPLYVKYCSIWMCLSSKEYRIMYEEWEPLDMDLICNESLLKLTIIVKYKHKVVYFSHYLKIGSIIDSIGIYLYRRPSTFAKICRLLAVCIINTSKTNTKIKQIIKKHIINTLLASYSMIENNAGISKDLWSLLSLFKYEYRFRMYGFWKSSIYPCTPELLIAKNESYKDIKYFLRRYHVDDKNHKKLGRNLSKYVSCHPCLVFELVLNQLQSYTGNVVTVVNGFRYLSNLDRDILVWEILKQCEISARMKIRADSNHALWFKALCDIMSHFFKFFCDTDMSPVIQYIINKLRMNRSQHLLVLSSIITELSQIEAFGEMVNTHQLEALAGSRNLKQLVLQLESVRNGNNTISRLSQTLVNGKMIVPLFILLCKQRMKLEIGESFAAFEILPTLMDITNDMFVQLFIFMQTHMVDEVGAVLVLQFPSLEELVMEYELPAQYAFMICRPFRDHMRIIGGSDDGSERSKEEVFQILSETVRKIMPKKLHGILSETLYATFWTLDISDIFIPVSLYNQACKTLKNKSNQHFKEIEHYSERLSVMKSKSSKSSMIELEYQSIKRKHLRDKKEIDSKLLAFENDILEQKKKIKIIQQIYFNSSNKWFYDHPLTAHHFLFSCILPRIFISDIDAKYCAKFICLCIKIGKKFIVIEFANILMENLNQILCSCTYAESRRLGRFLSEFMELMESYRANDKKFNSEFHSLPANVCDGHPMNFNDFCTHYRAMHRLLTIHLVHLLQSKTVPVLLWQKNAVLVLNEVRGVFPKVESHARHLKRRVTSIITVKGSSMEILCKRVIAMLENGLENKLYIDEQAFGGRNLFSKDKKSSVVVVVKSQHATDSQINELRKRALESQQNNKTPVKVGGNAVLTKTVDISSSVILKQNRKRKSDVQIERSKKRIRLNDGNTKMEAGVNGESVAGKKSDATPMRKNSGVNRSHSNSKSRTKFTPRQQSRDVRERERERDRNSVKGGSRGNNKSGGMGSEKRGNRNTNRMIDRKEKERKRRSSRTKH